MFANAVRMYVHTYVRTPHTWDYKSSRIAIFKVGIRQREGNILPLASLLKTTIQNVSLLRLSMARGYDNLR